MKKRASRRSRQTRFSGEDVWESNPPRTLFTPYTGFEDQEAHQLPTRPQI